MRHQRLSGVKGAVGWHQQPTPSYGMGRHRHASISMRSARSRRARTVASRAWWPAMTGWSCGCVWRAAGWPARTTRPTSMPRRTTRRPTIRSSPPSNQARPGSGATSINVSSDLRTAEDALGIEHPRPRGTARAGPERRRHRRLPLHTPPRRLRAPTGPAVPATSDGLILTVVAIGTELPSGGREP
jgi:hypothetical protein